MISYLLRDLQPKSLKNTISFSCSGASNQQRSPGSSSAVLTSELATSGGTPCHSPLESQPSWNIGDASFYNKPCCVRVITGNVLTIESLLWYIYTPVAMQNYSRLLSGRLWGETNHPASWALVVMVSIRCHCSPELSWRLVMGAHYQCSTTERKTRPNIQYWMGLF